VQDVIEEMLRQAARLQKQAKEIKEAEEEARVTEPGIQAELCVEPLASRVIALY
jgi:hypothetical protein